MKDAEFIKIIEQYQSMVFAICLQFTRDYQEAENLAQETFLSAYRYIDGCDPANYRPWLGRIAANKARDYLKSAAHRRETAAEVLPPVPSPSPESLYLAEEGREDIRQAVLRLKEPYRSAAVLYFLEEKTYAEIADLLQRNEKTVQTQVLRARKKLQQQLKGGKGNERLF